LAEKFGGSSQTKETRSDADDLDKGENTSQSVSDIRKKYEKKLAAHQESGNDVCHKTFYRLDKFSLYFINLLRYFLFFIDRRKTVKKNILCLELG